MKTRQPTGAPSHPFILLEGEAKTGRSWMAAAFTADERIGQSYWIELGAEGDGDLYGAVPGARYEIVEHDSDWRSVYQAVIDVRAEAVRAHAAGEPPVMLVFDQGGALWDLLSEWANNRAMTSNSNRKVLAEDPNANIDIGPNYWNPATKRWRQVMTQLMTFPGIVLLISRGRETALIGPGGNPVANKKDYRVDGHRSLPHDVNVHVRLAHGADPQIVGGRSVKVDMRPGAFRGSNKAGFSLGWLVFEALAYQPDAARVRAGVELHAGSDAPQSERAAVIEVALDGANTQDELRRAYTWIGPALDTGDITLDEAKALTARVKARKEELGMTPADDAGGAQVNGHRELASASA